MEWNINSPWGYELERKQYPPTVVINENSSILDYTREHQAQCLLNFEPPLFCGLWR